MKTSMRLLLAGSTLTLGLVLGLGSSAQADVILLEDGTYLEGKVVSETKRELTIETEGKVARRITVKKSDVKKRVREDRGPQTEARPGSGEGAGRDSGEFDPSRLTGRVLFAIDVSGSMQIGGRYDQAVEALYAMVAELPKKTEFDVTLFDEKQASLFDGDFLRASKRMKKRIKKHMKVKGVKIKRGTDLKALLDAALSARKVETIVLFTDGIPTAGVQEPRAILKAVGRLRQAKRAPTLHVRATLAGTFRDPKVEDKAGAESFLRLLAQEGGGTYARIDDDLKVVLRAPLRRSRAPEISLQYYKSRRKITSIELGTFPAFHLLVDDPALASGDFAIQEYPVEARIRVESYDHEGNLVDSPTEMEVARDGGRVYSVKYLRVTGPKDNQEDHGSHLDRRVYLKAFAGGILKVVYTRAGETFEKGIKILD